MNKLNLYNVQGAIVRNSLILAAFSTITFLVVVSEPDMFFIGLVFGGVICFFLSMFASFLIYLPILLYEEKKALSQKELFQKYLPLFVLLFLFGGGLFVQDDITNTVPLAMIVSAYLTSVLGWYLITKNVTEK